ncbi:hypothetical protein ACSBR2_018152 [Camellia fascicularis]
MMGERQHMSIQSIGRELQLWNWKGMLKFWSLLVFVVEEITLPPSLQLLKVLDLQDAPIEILPEELVDLFNLRYLSLKGTRVKELPKSIRKLCNLNTLDITNSKIEMLPGVEAQIDLMKRIRNMTQLKRIGITNVREVDEEDLCTGIQNMSLLHYLSVMVIDEPEYVRMDALSLTPHYLKMLILVGGQLCFSEGFHKLRKLGLCNIPQLNEIIIDKGVMSGLQEFIIRKSMQLKIQPHDIKYLEDLQELHLIVVTNELIECIRGEGKRDHSKVSSLLKSMKNQP